MKKENTVIVALAVTAAVAAAAWLILAAPAYTGNEINMTQGVTSQAATHFELHMIILWICIIIGVLVFGAMFTSIVLHRKSRGAEPAQFSHSTTAEIIWTVIPILILVGMAIPATSALVKMETTTGSEMTVKVTGFQWRWKYDYLDHDIRILSSLKSDSNVARQLKSGIDPTSVENYLLDVDHPLVLPVGRKTLMVGARLWLEEGRHPGFHQRSVDADRQAGHVPGTVRGIVWQGPWIHAHRGRGTAGCRIR
jgi:cytochrome c oxidase subunit 2